MKNTLILGYYNKKNIGDDYFQFLFKKILPNDNLIFYDPNKIKDIPKNIDLLICGGGDIITDYFTTKIIYLKKEFEKKYNRYLPSYAISVGISYPDQIKENNPYFLDIFDHIIVRNKNEKLFIIKCKKKINYFIKTSINR